MLLTRHQNPMTNYRLLMVNDISGNQMRRNTGITMHAFHQLRQRHTADGLKTCEERCGTWELGAEPSPITVAGATTSIIFCRDKHVFVTCLS